MQCRVLPLFFALSQLHSIGAKRRKEVTVMITGRIFCSSSEKHFDAITVYAFDQTAEDDNFVSETLTNTDGTYVLTAKFRPNSRGSKVSWYVAVDGNGEGTATACTRNPKLRRCSDLVWIPRRRIVKRRRRIFGGVDIDLCDSKDGEDED